MEKWTCTESPGQFQLLLRNKNIELSVVLQKSRFVHEVRGYAGKATSEESGMD